MRLPLTAKNALLASLLAALACGSTPSTGPAASGSSGAGDGAGAMSASGQGGSDPLTGGGAGTSNGGLAQGGNAGASGGGSGGSAAGGAGVPAVCPFTSDEYLLWPGTAPGSEGTALVETFDERSNEPQVHDRSLSGVSQPSLFPYLAESPNGAAAIVLPGGGYTHSAFDKEGVDIALWLNSLGVSAFVLKYRLPGEFPGKGWVALADAQRALRTLRKHALACSFDPEHLGVIGFSAGGHLASQLETRPSAETSPPTDELDTLDARPNFGVLMYPVISMDPAIAHAGSKQALLGQNPTPTDVMLASSELQVTAETPPTFLGVPKLDTTVKPENSVRFAMALETAGVTRELHQYEDGSHGVAIRNATGDIAAWPEQCAAWLKQIQITP